MTSKLTREQARQIIDAADALITALAGTNDEVHKDDTDNMVRLWDDLNDRYAPPEVIRDLARMALAAMDSEPYGYVNQFLYEQNGVSGLSNDHEYYHDSKSHIPLYRHAQPAPVVPEIDRKAIADKVYGKCSRIPGATFYNAAEFAIDEMEVCRAAMLAAAPQEVQGE